MNFLQKLQSADEERKRRWLVLSTVIVMVIVISVWLKYFGSIVRPEVALQVPEGSEQRGFSPFESLKGGALLAAQNVAGFFENLWDALRTPKSYIIEPPR